MCEHNKFEFVRVKYWALGSGWQIVNVVRCVSCKTEEDQPTDQMVYSREKDAIMYPIKKSPIT